MGTVESAANVNWSVPQIMNLDFPEPAIGGSLVMLRVVGCPPAAACQRNPNCYKGRASYKPRGRKPRGQIQPLPDLWRFEVPSHCNLVIQTCETSMQWSALRTPLCVLFAIGNARWCANACPILYRQAHPN